MFACNHLCLSSGLISLLDSLVSFVKRSCLCACDYICLLVALRVSMELGMFAFENLRVCLQFIEFAYTDSRVVW